MAKGIGAGLLAIAVMFGCAMPAAAQSNSPVQLGLLRCDVDGASGRILGSRRELVCVFENADMRPVENYAGEIVRIGIDLGGTEYSEIAWGVFALTDTGAVPGVLEGTYAGVSAGVSLGVGLGANALIGGLDRSIALQPLSLEASRGFNLALGVAQLELLSVGGIEMQME